MDELVHQLYGSRPRADYSTAAAPLSGGADMFGRRPAHPGYFPHNGAAAPDSYGQRGGYPGGYYDPYRQYPPQPLKRKRREAAALVLRGGDVTVKPFSQLPRGLLRYARQAAEEEASAEVKTGGVPGYLMPGFGMPSLHPAAATAAVFQAMEHRSQVVNLPQGEI